MAAKRAQSQASVVNTNVVFVSDQTLIQDAVKIMVERKISSLLVTDSEDSVVGIITERDIVQKFTLLEMPDKLTHVVNTIMNRPVIFVSLANLDHDIARLHIEKRIRHFPVLQGAEPRRENVVGILSVTDILRRYLETYYDAPKLAAGPGLKLPEQPEGHRRLYVLAKTPAIAEPYLTIFARLGMKTAFVADFARFVGEATAADALLFDLDGYFPRELSNPLVMARKFRGDVIMATSNLALLTGMRRFLDKSHQDILVKPIDFSYGHWLLTNKWLGRKAS
jgi:CBS domain-containing protein